MADQMKIYSNIENIDQNLKKFYIHLMVFAGQNKELDLPELFLKLFNDVKRKISNDPNKIQLYLKNTIRYESKEKFLLLIYSYYKLKKIIEEKDDKLFSDLPISFNKVIIRLQKMPQRARENIWKPLLNSVVVREKTWNHSRPS